MLERCSRNMLFIIIIIIIIIIITLETCWCDESHTHFMSSIQYLREEAQLI